MALFAVVVLLLVLILEAASVWTSAASALPAPGRWGRAPAGAVVGDAARRGRRARAPGAAAAHIRSKWQDLTPGAMPHRHDGVCRQAPSRRGLRGGRPSGQAVRASAKDAATSPYASVSPAAQARRRAVNTAEGSACGVLQQGLLCWWRFLSPDCSRRGAGAASPARSAACRAGPRPSPADPASQRSRRRTA